MKYLLPILLLACCAATLPAQQNSTINFNLIQVNHYHGQEQLTDSASAPARRIVVDLGNPQAALQLFPDGQPAISLAPVGVTVEEYGSPTNNATTVPWESSTVLRSSTGLDSFLVSASRTGCPGTEVRPSVAVAFAKATGWSDPPIRFGPLNTRTRCPLGGGYELEVALAADQPPAVKLCERPAFGRR